MEDMINRDMKEIKCEMWNAFVCFRVEPSTSYSEHGNGYVRIPKKVGSFFFAKYLKLYCFMY